jgi:hypothetical protein
MSTRTLEELRADQARIASEIAEVEQAMKAAPSVYTLGVATIELQAGEIYAGLVLDAATGGPSHHLILLPGEAGDVTWQQAKDWASSMGGELPTRQEQALLYANVKREFQPRWYWSAEQYSDSDAWSQYFGHGTQSSDSESYEGRARAVRRFDA